MRGLPTGACRDLGVIVQAYPPDKRLTVNVPVGTFDGPVEKGAEVVVEDHGLKVRGRVKRMVAEVEIDLATLDEPQHEGQGTLA